MATGNANGKEWVDEPTRCIQRAIVMHGTSPDRREGARLLAGIVAASGAKGAAYGWTDALAPDLLAPVHSVACQPEICWEVGLPDTTASLLDNSGAFSWRLMIRGADEAGLARSARLVSRAAGWFADARDRDAPKVHASVASRACSRFIALLDAYRTVGFHIGDTRHVAVLKDELYAELHALPEPTRAAGASAIESLSDHVRLAGGLVRLGSALDVAGSLPEAVSLHVIAYELALKIGDGVTGIDAARAAGRAYRGLTEWDESFRWYRLARAIAEYEGDQARLAIVLDGEGNSHRQRGAFPAARECYERAWGIAAESGDVVAIGAVGHSMMIVERDAGRLESASRFAWSAISSQTDQERRARLLIDLGTLLLEFGDMQAAGHAYRVAARLTVDVDMMALALVACAHVQALVGEWPTYETTRRRAWIASRRATPRVRAQAGYHRGLCLLIHGRPSAAHRILGVTEMMAQASGVATWSVKAGELRDSIDRHEPPPTPESGEAPTEVRRGLVELAAAMGV